MQNLKKFIVCCGLMMLGGEISQATDELPLLISAVEEGNVNEAQNILRDAKDPDALIPTALRRAVENAAHAYNAAKTNNNTWNTMRTLYIPTELNHAAKQNIDILEKFYNAKKIIQKLIEIASDKDALIQKEYENGKTALICAVEMNCWDIAEMLLDAITDKATRQGLIEESLAYADNARMISLLRSYNA